MMLTLSGLSNVAPSITLDGVQSQEISQWTVEECVAAPTRFEAWVKDPSGNFAASAVGLIGSSVKVTLDSGSIIDLQVGGRRSLLDASGGSSCVIYGFDASVALKVGRKLRSFADLSFEELVKKVLGNSKLEIEVSEVPAGRLGSATQWVQYLESDWQFLYRLAYQGGMHVWPSRGKLCFGEGPGRENKVTLDATPSSGFGYEMVEFDIDDGYSLVPSGHVFPTFPALFPEAPTPDEGLSSLAEITTDSKVTLPVDQYQQFPAGLAIADADSMTLARARANFVERERIHGHILLAGTPPEGLQLGCCLRLVRHGHKIIEDATVMRITHEFYGAARRTRIWLGRQANQFTSIPDLFPAKHLWLAQVCGEYDPQSSTIEVKVHGWATAIEPLRARVKAISAKKGAGVLFKYEQDEWVLVGFEQGNPDAPVVLGSILVESQPNLTVEQCSLLAALLKDSPINIDLDASGLSINWPESKFVLRMDAEAKEWLIQVGEATLKLGDSTSVVAATELSLTSSKIQMSKG